MIESFSFVVIGGLLGWLAAREYSLRATSQQFFALEQAREADRQAARDRELALIDQYLRRNQAQPLVAQEPVLKIPDPEAVQYRSEWDEAMRLDAIKEEIEQSQPEAAWVNPQEARAQWPDLWKQAEAKWEIQHAPLRV